MLTAAQIQQLKEEKAKRLAKQINREYMDGLQGKGPIKHVVILNHKALIPLIGL